MGYEQNRTYYHHAPILAWSNCIRTPCSTRTNAQLTVIHPLESRETTNEYLQLEKHEWRMDYNNYEDKVKEKNYKWRKATYVTTLFTQSAFRTCS